MPCLTFLYYFVLCLQNGKFKLTQSFTNHSHQGSVRQLSVSGKYLASGGTDEIIRIFNLNKRREEGTIMENHGNSIQLDSEKFLLLFYELD